MRVGVMEGTGDDDFTAGGRIVPAVVLTGRDDPCEDGGGKDARRQQRERMRKLAQLTS
jgi:hypothetical protein